MERIIDLSVVAFSIGIPLLIVLGIVVEDIASPYIERLKLSARNRYGRTRVHNIH